MAEQEPDTAAVEPDTTAVEPDTTVVDTASGVTLEKIAVIRGGGAAGVNPSSDVYVPEDKRGSADEPAPAELSSAQRKLVQTIIDRGAALKKQGKLSTTDERTAQNRAARRAEAAAKRG